MPAKRSVLGPLPVRNRRRMPNRAQNNRKRDEKARLTITVDNPTDLVDVATQIGIELRDQYVLGYRPKNLVLDG